MKKIAALVFAASVPAAACGACTMDMLTLQLPYWKWWLLVLSVWALAHALVTDSDGRERGYLLVLVGMLSGLFALAVLFNGARPARLGVAVVLVGVCLHQRHRLLHILSWLIAGFLGMMGVGFLLAFTGMLLPLGVLVFWYVSRYIAGWLQKSHPFRRRRLVLNHLALLLLVLSAGAVVNQAKSGPEYYLGRISDSTGPGRSYILRVVTSGEVENRTVERFLQSEDPYEIRTGVTLVRAYKQLPEALVPAIQRALERSDLDTGARSDLESTLSGARSSS